MFTVNGVLGPALGGALVALVGAQASLLLNAASFLLAAAALGDAGLAHARDQGFQ